MGDTTQDYIREQIATALGAADRGDEVGSTLRGAAWVVIVLAVAAAGAAIVAAFRDIDDADRLALIGIAFANVVIGSTLAAVLRGIGSICETNASQLRLQVLGLPEDLDA